MSRISLTPRQRDCFNYIDRFIAANGYSPGLRQIAKGLGLKNHSCVVHMIDALQDRGWITRLPNCRNSISIIPDDKATDGDLLDRLLGPELCLKLRAHCRQLDDDPLRVLADAVALHLDQVEAEDDVAA